jgi:MoxR-like ATPase
MTYAILISGQVNSTDTKQLIIASHNGNTHTFMRVTNGGRGESNAWSARELDEHTSIGTLDYNLIGEVLSTPLTNVDEVALNNNEIPNVLIQKLSKQYRLRNLTIDTTRTIQSVVDEVQLLIAQDPALLSKYRSDGRSDKNATTKTNESALTKNKEIVMTTINPIANEAIVINRVERNEDEVNLLAFVPSLTLPDVRSYVPRTFANGLTEEQVYRYALKTKKNVSIQGPAGTGKTTSLMTFSAKNGLEFGSMSCNAGAEPSQFFGRMTPTKEGKLEWRDGIFTYFFRNGGVLVIDEADFLPQKVASSTHSALDGRRLLTLLDNNGEVITAHENLLIVMCYNGNGYRGTSKMNEAFNDRYAIKLTFDYDTSIEKKFIPSSTLLELATSMRADTIAGVYETPVSTRLLKNFVDLAQNLSYDFAVDNFVNNFKEDERSSVKLLLDSQRHNLELELIGKVSE